MVFDGEEEDHSLGAAGAANFLAVNLADNCYRLARIHMLRQILDSDDAASV